MTDYFNVGRIDLTPHAFANEEELLRTIIHEGCHVKQLKKYGRDKPNGACPICGGHNFETGYIELNSKDHLGWGAVWCEDCRSAFVLSRVILTDEEARKKIVSALPDDLKYS